MSATFATLRLLYQSQIPSFPENGNSNYFLANTLTMFPVIFELDLAVFFQKNNNNNNNKKTHTHKNTKKKPKKNKQQTNKILINEKLGKRCIPLLPMLSFCGNKVYLFLVKHKPKVLIKERP